MSVSYEAREAPPFIDESSSDEGKHEDAFEKTAQSPGEWVPPQAWIQRFLADYTGEHGGETAPAGADVQRCKYSVLTMDETVALEHLKFIIVEHANDYTFDKAFMARIKELVQGNTLCGMEYDDWSYTVAKVTGQINNWSPYAEVRAVTLPYDDMDQPCETIRSYLLAAFWVCQPGISIPGNVVQLQLVPMGRCLAAVLPDWGFTLFGTRHSLNPGPWGVKEQLFATLTVNGASAYGNFTGLLVMRLSIFFDQPWATMGFNVL